MTEHPPGPLAELRYKCLDEAIDELMAGSLLRSCLVAWLDQRDLAALRTRFDTLAGGALPARADSALRFVACMQAVADVLGANFELRLTPDQVDQALLMVENESYLWPSFLDMALGLAIRWGDGECAQALWKRRMGAPLGIDLHALGLLSHAMSLRGPDSQSMADLGHLAGDAALFMAGTSVASTLLGLAAVHGAKQFAQALLDQARVWNAATCQVQRSEGQWSLNTQQGGLSLSVEIRGSGDLHTCAAWALDDLVYELPGHLDRMLNKQVPMAQIAGAKTRAQVVAALNQGQVNWVAKLHGVHLSPADRDALVARQDGALAWIRHHHSVMRGVQANLRIEVSDDRQ